MAKRNPSIGDVPVTIAAATTPEPPSDAGVDAPAEPSPTAALRLIQGPFAGDHADWPEGTVHYADAREHHCPNPSGVFIYAPADPLLVTSPLDTFTLLRVERRYGG